MNLSCTPHTNDVICFPLTYHYYAGNVEADATGNNGVGRREIERAGRQVAVIADVDNRGLRRAVQTQRYGHEGYEGGQQPDYYDCGHRYASRYPTTVPGKEICKHIVEWLTKVREDQMVV